MSVYKCELFKFILLINCILLEYGITGVISEKKRGLITLTRLAQLVERTPFKRVVVGSSPTSGDSDETT